MNINWDRADRLLRHWGTVGGLARYDEWTELAESPDNYPEMLARIARFLERGDLAGTEHGFLLRQFADTVRSWMAPPATAAVALVPLADEEPIVTVVSETAQANTPDPFRFPRLTPKSDDDLKS